ncbi:MAG: hypothetical protein VX304_12340, partial [Planctomycetota bacterium]|nr:hypothetical protein [Planctomycetota bacterium]
LQPAAQPAEGGGGAADATARLLRRRLAAAHEALGLAERERYDEAVRQLEAAVAGDKRFVMAWFQLARIELLRENETGYQRASEQLRRLNPRLAGEFPRSQTLHDRPSP